MADAYDEKAREIGKKAMLHIVNEWHRQVGIDDVMKTKLTRAIADTVATRVVEEALAPALRQAAETARAEEREACAKKAFWLLINKRRCLDRNGKQIGSYARSPQEIRDAIRERK